MPLATGPVCELCGWTPLPRGNALASRPLSAYLKLKFYDVMCQAARIVSNLAARP
jgi:hypothetical protein